MQVVILARNYKASRPHPVFVALKRRLASRGIELTIDPAWSDAYANADLLIAVEPIADPQIPTTARLLGQRTLNRLQRMEIAADNGIPAPRFVSPSRNDEFAEAVAGWGDVTVLKYDWSARRNGVFLWPIGADAILPPDFRPGCDLFMEFLGDDPATYKVDAFAGRILNGWIFPTRSMRLPDWQVIEDPQFRTFEIPEELADQISAASTALLGYGVGYASFDLMYTDDGFRLIEVNSCGASTAPWNNWPDRYAEAYAEAIARLLQNRDAIPRYGALRDRAVGAGNEASAVILPTQEAVPNAGSTPALRSAVKAGEPASVVICDSRDNDDVLARLLIEAERLMTAAGVRVTTMQSWSDDCADADLVICVDPIADRDGLTDARLLGQKTMTRQEALQFAEAAGMRVARFGSPSDDAGLSALARDWGEMAVLKYDWSQHRSGIFLWPLADGRKPFPSDFQAGLDLFMEFLDGPPETYKVETLGGTMLGSWMLPTRSMRSADWQVIAGSIESFEPPPDLRLACEAVGKSLLQQGVAHASFDFMRHAGGFVLVELNICGIGKTAWKHRPERYASNFAGAVIAALRQREDIPRYRDLRARATRAGNEWEPAVLRERRAMRTTGGIADHRASAEQGFHDSLIQTERLTPDRMTQFVRRSAAKLLLHCFDSVPFYRTRLADAIRWDRNIDWERWNEIPLTTRADAAEHRHAMLSRDIPVHHGSMQHVRTAGATGERIVVSQAALHVAAVSCLEARLTRWHGIEPAEEMATLLPNVRGEAGRYRTWAPKWLPQPHGRDHRGDGSAPPEEQLQWLASLGPVYLRTRPSMARSLALAVRASPQLKPRLKGILTRGEILTDDVRRLCARYLGHPPIDVYELTEAGPVAISCPRCGAYHLQSEVCLTELLRDDGRPCGAGEIGQIVVTPLYNFAMPLIRYATGDFAVTPDAAETCAFVGLPRIKRVLGRSRNLIRLAGRPPCQPPLDSELLWDTLGASQWQFAQTGPSEFELRFVSDRPDASLRISEAERHLRLTLGTEEQVPIGLKRVAAIPADTEGRKEPICCEA